MASPIAEKKTRGRQKVEIKKMTNEKNLKVTFSKRRTGLFKKAGTLSTLCGAEVAIIVFSPGGKPFTFAHPNLDGVLNRFLTQNNRVYRLKGEMRKLREEVQAEKQRAAELRWRRREMEDKFWWAAPFDTLSNDQLLVVKASLEHLHKDLTDQLNPLLLPSVSNANVNPPHDDFFVAPPPVQTMTMYQNLVFPSVSNANVNPPHDYFFVAPPPAPMMMMDQNLVFPSVSNANFNPPHDDFFVAPPPAPMTMIDQNLVFDGNMMVPAPRLDGYGGPAGFF